MKPAYDLVQSLQRQLVRSAFPSRPAVRQLRHHHQARKPLRVHPDGGSDSDLRLLQPVASPLAGAVQEERHRPAPLRRVLARHVDDVAVAIEKTGLAWTRHHRRARG